MEKAEQILPVWNGPVFRKPRLPRTLAWVIGVERLSERFQEVPQFHNLKVWFDAHPVDGEYRVTVMRAAATQSPQQVFAVWYSSRGPDWYFMVYPVESERRAHVRELLEEHAFPVVDKWMKSFRSEVRLYTDKHLRIIWERTTDRMIVKEEDR